MKEPPFLKAMRRRPSGKLVDADELAAGVDRSRRTVNRWVTDKRLERAGTFRLAFERDEVVRFLAEDYYPGVLGVSA